VEGSRFKYFHQCTRFNKVGSLRWCRLEILISKCLEPTLDPFLLSLLIRSSPFLSRWKAYGVFFEVEASRFKYFHQCTRFNKVGSLRWCRLEILLSKCLEPTLDPFLLSLLIRSSPFLSRWEAYGVFFEVEASRFKYFHQCTRFNKVGSLRWCRLEILTMQVIEADLGSILALTPHSLKPISFLLESLWSLLWEWRIQDSNISINAHALTKLVP